MCLSFAGGITLFFFDFQFYYFKGCFKGESKAELVGDLEWSV